MVNLLSRYPDANIYGYPTDSDIIRLVLLAIYFNTSSAKYNGLCICNYNIDINLNIVSKQKTYFNNAIYISKLLEIISCYPK